MSSTGNGGRGRRCKFSGNAAQGLRDTVMRVLRRDYLTVIVIGNQLHGLMKMGAPGFPLVFAEFDCAVGEQVG
jgi:hypothetical protein